MMTLAGYALTLALLGAPAQNHHTARLTAYCKKCPDGGGPRTRTEELVGEGGVAADPRYWGPGSIVEIKLKSGWTRRRVNDTGGAIKGKWRFDLGFSNHRMCTRLSGKRQVRVILWKAPVPVRKWPNLGKGRR